MAIQVGKVPMADVRLPEEVQMKGAVTSYMVRPDRKLREACAPKIIFTNRKASLSLKKQISTIMTRKSMGFLPIKLYRFKMEKTSINKTLTILVIEFQLASASIEARI